MNTKLRQKAKNNFEKDFFKLINNSVLGKTTENIRKLIKLETTERRRNYLVSEANYHITNFFYREFISNKMKKKLNFNE